MEQPVLLIVVVLATAGLPIVLLHRLARRLEHWLVACLAAGGLYVAVSLKLDQAPSPAWMKGLGWGLLALVLYCFGRYWWWRKSADGSSENRDPR